MPRKNGLRLKSETGNRPTTPTGHKALYDSSTDRGLKKAVEGQGGMPSVAGSGGRLIHPVGWLAVVNSRLTTHQTDRWMRYPGWDHKYYKSQGKEEM